MKTILLMLMAVVMVGCALRGSGEWNPPAKPMGDGIGNWHRTFYGEKYNWNSQVGTYTLDQAMLEFGPPEATSKLGNGNTVASWSKFNGFGGVHKRILQFDKYGKLVTGKSTGRMR